METIGEDLLTTLLTSLSLESCIPIFHHQTIDVFCWLKMKQPDDYLTIGIESIESCKILALFTRALQIHLNGLPPMLFDDDIVEDGNDDTQERIQRTIALFDLHTKYDEPKSIHWSDRPCSQSTSTLPPSYEPTRPKRMNSLSKSTGLIRRLSLRQKPIPRPISVNDYLPSSGNLIHSINQQQQQQQRDQVQRKRWEKRRSCIILPREEEGQEELPAYQCTVYKRGHVYVKREREGPKRKTRWNRSWKQLHVELWGTLLFFYTIAPSQDDSMPLASLLAYKTPLETINLARAEAFRAWDYVKRPHALRLVTDQGPHLLLRLDTHLEMISWIEHLQAAINISLDLELRPMPKFMTLPTRFSTDPRVLQFERLREERMLEQNEMLI